MKTQLRAPDLIDTMVSPENIVTVNMADMLDSPEDELLQDLYDHGFTNISPAEAAVIVEWHRERLTRDATEKEMYATEKEMSRLRAIITFFATQATAVSMWGLLYAADIVDVIGRKSMAEKARELGVTKQALSKKAIYWTDALGLPQSKSMRLEETRDTFRKAAVRNHKLKREAV